MEKEIVILKEESSEASLSLLSENSENLIDIKQEGAGGTSDYQALLNKPSINGVELNGNKTLEELGIPEQLEAGENVEIVNNKISVPTASDVEEDNTKPISASAVYKEVGNISILLQTI